MQERARHRDREFIAAEARHQTDISSLLLQPLGNRLQHVVAVGMSEEIVNVLKSIKSEHK